MNVLLTALLAVCIAVNCGQSAAVSRRTDLEQSRPQTAVLEAAAEGETERLPATLYEFSVPASYYGGVKNIGMCGGSLYLPDEGWTKTAGLGAQLEAVCASFESLPGPDRPYRERVLSFGGEVSAALCRGEGYTLYIPETGWRRTEDPARRETVWTSAEDSRAWFSVRAFPGLGGQEDLPALRREMERAYPQRTFAAGTPDRDPFVLRSVDDALAVFVRFYQLGEDAYAVTRWFPNEGEGAGTDIFAITGTFRLTDG